MLRSKRGFALLGICGLSLGLVMFGTSISQAEKGANWMVKGANISVLHPIVQIQEILNKTISLEVTTGGGTKVEILCTAAEFLNAKLEAEGSISPGNITRFTGCITKLNGALNKSCEPRTEGKPGVVVSNPLKGLLILKESTPVIEFKPVTGETFVILSLGELCTIGEELPVTGTSTVEDQNGKFTTEAVSHTVRQGPGSKLIFWGASAKVSGGAVLQLAGEHSGLTWSALPG